MVATGMCSPRRSWRSCAASPRRGRGDLIRYFTFTAAEEAFVRKHRGQGNVLGAAVQLCTLPWAGFVPDEVASAPAVAVERLSARLGIPVGELRGYGAGQQTRHRSPAGDHRLPGRWAFTITCSRCVLSLRGQG